MSTEAALIRLAQSSSEAAGGILEMFAPGQVQAGDIAVLDAGKLVEVGTHDELLARNGIYAEIYRDQLHGAEA